MKAIKKSILRNAVKTNGVTALSPSGDIIKLRRNSFSMWCVGIHKGGMATLHALYKSSESNEAVSEFLVLAGYEV